MTTNIALNIPVTLLFNFATSLSLKNLLPTHSLSNKFNTKADKNNVVQKQ